MGILDGFMPGENQGVQGGLLSNLPLQIGLSILANNTGHYGAALPAIGQGALKGFQNVQRQKELEQQRLMQSLQMQEAQRKMADAQRIDDARKTFIQNHPDLADAVNLDPSLAIKAAYPSLAKNTADPYTTIEYDDKGQAYLHNHRETDPTKAITPLMINGAPFIGAKNSPTLQGQIQGAKSQSEAEWKPNTDVNGVVSTNANVVKAVNGGLPTNNFNTGYPVTWGAPGTTATDKAEGTMTDSSVSVRNPSNPNPMLPRGLKVPTKAELAAQEAAAKIEAESKANNKVALPDYVANAENTSNLVDQLVGSKDGKTPAHPGFQTAVGASSKLDPRNYLSGTDATNFRLRLDQLKGQQFLQAYNNLKGGGSITEVEGMKATDAISRMNTSSSEDEFVKAARDFQDVIQRGIARAKLKAGVSDSASNPAQSASGVRKYNPTTGKIE